MSQQVMPSERQSAGWGIRIATAPFGILRLPLLPSSRKRKCLLKTAVHLNEHSTYVGLNQIQTLYSNEESHVQPWIRQVLLKQDSNSNAQ